MLPVRERAGHEDGIGHPHGGGDAAILDSRSPLERVARPDGRL